VAGLCAVARSVGALTYVDAVHYGPHGLIDVETLGCDFLACSSYKFFGPHLGIVWGRQGVLAELEAYKVRPATEELPWRFELGTPQIELQAGLSATVAYFAWLGQMLGDSGPVRSQLTTAFDGIRVWESGLTQRLVNGLAAIDGVTIHGIRDHLDRRVATVSFTHATLPPPEIARALAERNIFVWSGNNYALEVVRALQLDEDDGVVRIGLVHYNTPAEADAIVEAVAEVTTRSAAPSR
ncbi:MAG: aminotransferase class V-fold PLP-dependent enzyme, partial [Candidatus Eremiobacteraeota bacterium]|nr:aminotransferase class V-fold PLP-dependent enzyme [Candidatus Eremiobacteraeota bacterium]